MCLEEDHQKVTKMNLALLTTHMITWRLVLMLKNRLSDLKPIIYMVNPSLTIIDCSIYLFRSNLKGSKAWDSWPWCLQSNWYWQYWKILIINYTVIKTLSKIYLVTPLQVFGLQASPNDLNKNWNQIFTILLQEPTIQVILIHTKDMVAISFQIWNLLEERKFQRLVTQKCLLSVHTMDYLQEIVSKSSS